MLLFPLSFLLSGNFFLILTHSTYCFCFRQVFLPGDSMENDEELTFDKSAYDMYHAVSLKLLFFTYFCMLIVRNKHFENVWLLYSDFQEIIGLYTMWFEMKIWSSQELIKYLKWFCHVCQLFQQCFIQIRPSRKRAFCQFLMTFLMINQQLQ